MPKTYAEKLKDPKWQKKRLKILERDGWECRYCGNSKITLHVHHIKYKKGFEPWEYDEDDLLTLCEICHEADKKGRAFFENILIDSFRYLPGYYMGAVAVFFREPEEVGFDKELRDKIIRESIDKIESILPGKGLNETWKLGADK